MRISRFSSQLLPSRCSLKRSSSASPPNRYPSRSSTPIAQDLKPGNILVTAEGEVKLLDFGIAKLLGPEQTGDLPATVTMARLMTPQYASPEQVKGDSISTLTDVYSLGFVLYELLTGHRPYHLLRAAMHEIDRKSVRVGKEC